MTSKILLNIQMTWCNIAKPEMTCCPSIIKVIKGDYYETKYNFALSQVRFYEISK